MGSLRPSLRIFLEDRTARLSEGDQRKIRRLARALTRRLGFPSGQINLLFVTDAAIRKINRRYLRQDRPTDVMAFSYLEKKNLFPQGMGPAARPLLGEVVISLETAKRQSREWGTPFFYEVIFYVCHGLLHLLGWEDRTPRLRSRMMKKQAAELTRAGLGYGHP